MKSCARQLNLPQCLVIAIAVFGLLALLVWQQQPGRNSPNGKTITESETSPATKPVLAPAAKVDPRKQLQDSAFNDLLVEGLSPQRQTDIIGNLLIDYWITQRSLPTGTQQEIYEALAGKNRREVVYAPREHPVFTDKGFQAKGDDSSIVLHVRSSREGTFDLIHTGPDLLLFTEDDQVRAFRQGS